MSSADVAQALACTGLSSGAVHERRAVQRDEQVARPGSARSARPRAGRRKRGSIATRRVDHRVADEVRCARRRCLRARRFSIASSRVDEEEVGELVGDDPVDLLGHRAVEAAQAGLDVRDRDAAASPRRAPRRASSSRRRGRSRGPGAPRSRTGSRRSITRAVCTACVPEPTPSRWSGSGMPSSSRKTSDISAVVVLARVDERRAAPSGSRRRSAAMTGAIFTKFGRAPTTARRCA